MASHLPTYLFACLVLITSEVNLSSCTNITLLNHCNETVWPAVTDNKNLTGHGYELKPGQSAVFDAPWDWEGEIWGRTGCNFNSSGNDTCQTGACGTTLVCTTPATSPASVAGFMLMDNVDTYLYHVSISDGFNLPLTVNPVNGKGICKVAGCENDLRSYCPPELMVRSSDGKNIACRSACNVFHSDEYCCTGMYSSSDTCLPTNYSRILKSGCPNTRTSSLDTMISSTCMTSAYTVKFCSERKQTCTSHDSNLVCSSSNGMQAAVWSAFVLVLVVITSFMNVVFS